MSDHVGYSPLASYPRPLSHHRSFSVQYKLRVVQWMEQQKHCSLRAAAKHFGLDRKVIRSWLKNRESLKAALTLYGPEKRKLHAGRPPASQELDQQVLDYLVNSQRDGLSVCDQQLQRKARECALALGLKDFKGAATWLKRWKARCGLDKHNQLNKNSCQEHNEAAQLSHVMSGELVKLLANWSAPNQPSNDRVTDGPVHYDTSTSEHNYCKGTSLLLDHTPTLADLTDNDAPYRILTSTHEEQPFPMTSSEHPALLAVFEVVPPANDDITIFGEECIMGSLDLPLSHEEIVRDNDDDITPQIMVDQGDHTPLDTPTAKPKNIKRRRGKGRGQSCCQATTRKPADKKSCEVPLVQATLPNLMLDDPQGPSGLLASRMLQPVFPDEPEIVYMDMQLGTLTH